MSTIFLFLYLGKEEREDLENKISSNAFVSARTMDKMQFT